MQLGPAAIFSFYTGLAEKYRLYRRAFDLVIRLIVGCSERLPKVDRAPGLLRATGESIREEGTRSFANPKWNLTKGGTFPIASVVLAPRRARASNQRRAIP